ncbi:phosphonate C-P lyase system protein PhnH [Mycolicibacterium thermoresistibile]|uniref:Phosphonate C-P lyase system protein PhnH n=2 Tax=Mycolicibacterium thermoresistibile TaxID=1797 RepID=G7CBM9_MYCT3|nr:phosphonate C-P lyase system protein PhnH [Mycolicibacterium thermoresistibile]EHI14533.1 hypothetical protein KEK_01865 [Mycolicibacterium thermoresistibile ATCC 19527]GAT17542.1 putative uncharacterized protein [Mycolicibacterium thermoresistibile]SNW18294.1 carbon-phosphorus lyase complex subunit [Mycolicibacterium thermoresistibile]
MWDMVHDGRETFLAVMRAMCAPGTPIRLPRPVPLCGERDLDGAAAILLALLDRGLTLAVAGPALVQRLGAAVIAHTGAETTGLSDADWVLVHGPAADAITRARRGSTDRPEAGASIVIAASGPAIPVVVSGPGVHGHTTAHIALDDLAVHAFTAANAAAPCGVDLFVVTGQQVTALPRSVSVQPGVTV